MPNCFRMINLKWNLLQDILDKKRKVYEVAEILNLSRQNISISLKRYKEEWINWIIPKKPWPKWWFTHNKTEK